MKYCQLRSIPILIASPKKITSYLLAHIQNQNEFLPVVTFNITMFGAHSSGLMKWLKAHALFTVDGIGISLLMLILKCRFVQRFPGIDMVQKILQDSETKLNVAMIGAPNQSLLGASEWVGSFGHNVVFQKNGFELLSQDDFNSLKDAQADLILVACGCPKQDEIIHQVSTVLTQGVAIGVGGSFDVWSGRTQRAPFILRLLGLEWFYRMIREPFRLGRLIRSAIYFFTPKSFVKD